MKFRNGLLFVEEILHKNEVVFEVFLLLALRIIQNTYCIFRLPKLFMVLSI